MFMFPKTCLICDKKINENSIFTCENCFNIIKYELRNAICRSDSIMHFDKLISCFLYRGIIRDRILKFKFKNKAYLGRYFGKVICEQLIRNAILADVIIPVPMHFARYLKRGYNQSSILAREIARDLKISLKTNVLIKIKKSAVQSTLASNLRRQNVKDTYGIRHKDVIRDKKVLLVDDIYTTGATSNECAKVLKENGAKSVIVATIAYGSLVRGIK